MFCKGLAHRTGFLHSEVKRLVFLVLVVVTEVNLHFLVVHNVDTGDCFPYYTAEIKNYIINNY